MFDYISNQNNILSDAQAEDNIVTRRVHKLLKEFQERLDVFKPNTALAAFMEWLHDTANQNMKLSKDSAEKVIVALSVMAPHMASELLELVLQKQLSDCSWSYYNPEYTYENTVEIIVQVNGKLRGEVVVERGAQQSVVEALAQEKVVNWLKDKEVVKVVFVKDKLINFVVK